MTAPNRDVPTMPAPANSYDDVPYPSLPFAQTHPDHLAAIAALFGRPVAQHAGWRILELGCAAGGNLIPLAEQLPGATLVGVDASARQIAQGRALVDALGLEQVRLVHADIEAIDASYGEFDFIICHGVYSWVPSPVQDSILRVCRERLRPDGVAYISYNTLPGWHMRRTIRDLMREHVRGIDSPAEQVEQARAILDFLAAAAPASDPAYSSLLQRELQQLRDAPDAYIFHEHLEAVNEPVYFRDFITRAAARDLAFLAESDLGSMLTLDLPDNVAATVGHLSGNALGQQQLLDFIRNRAFRQSLLIRGSNNPNTVFSLARLDELRLASPLLAVPNSSSGPDSWTFTRSGGSNVQVSTTAALTAAALNVLGKRWPENLPWAALLELARAEVGTAVSDSAIETLRFDLLRGVANSLVTLHTRPAACCAEPPERPQASALARHQAISDTTVTTLRHNRITLDAPHRALLRELDGSQSAASLSAKFVAAGTSQNAEDHSGLLHNLARAGLLLA